VIREQFRGTGVVLAMDWSRWTNVPQHRSEQFAAVCAAIGLALTGKPTDPHLKLVAINYGSWVYFYGARSTGKSMTLAAVRTLSERWTAKVCWTYVNCRALVNGERFMASIAQGCHQVAKRAGTPVPPLPTRWNLPLFLHVMSDMLVGLARKDVHVVCHLEGAEWLRSLGDSGRVLTAMRRLSSAATGFCDCSDGFLQSAWNVILESRVPPEHLFDPVERSCFPDFVLFCPPYDRSALRGLLLARQCQKESLSSSEMQVSEADDRLSEGSFVTAFVNTLLDVLYDLTNDLSELCFWYDTLLPVYRRGWRARQGRTAALAAAYSTCLPHFKEAIKRIYTRSSILLNESTELPNVSPELPTWRIMLCTGSYVSKALLLAGYLAARIPPGRDRKLFEKSGEKQGIRKRRQTRRAPAKEKPGTKPVSLDRLERIGRYILQRYAEMERSSITTTAFYRAAPSGSVLAGLIGHGFFSRITRAHAVERQRVRCYVSRDLAQELAKEAGIVLEDYIGEVL
jgi:hypothetical protein